VSRFVALPCRSPFVCDASSSAIANSFDAHAAAASAPGVPLLLDPPPLSGDSGRDFRLAAPSTAEAARVWAMSLGWRRPLRRTFR